MDIRWAAPPDTVLKKKAERDTGVYKVLASRPGEYAIIATYPKRASADVRLSNITRGKVKAARDLGRFEGCVYQNDEGTWDLYLRMVP